MTRLPFLLATAVLAAASVAAGQSRHDSSAPINFGADHIELQDKAHRTILSGNVLVKQAEMTLNAAQMTVLYRGQVMNGASPEAQLINASGRVTVIRPQQTAKSNYAVYDLNKHLITMFGAVSLNQNGNTVNGGRLTINLDTGRAVIDGSGVAGGGGATGLIGTDKVTQSGGRVTGTFSVPKRD